MDLIQENERNRVFRKGASVYKYFTHREEFEREKNALLFLKESQTCFKIQEIEEVSDEELWIRTDFISEGTYNRIEKISLMQKPENQRILTRFLLDLHSLHYKDNVSLTIKGMVEKAVAEGASLQNVLEKETLKYVAKHKNWMLATYGKLAKTCFVHGDIQPDNLFFDNSGKLLGFFDWGSSGNGSPEIDLRQLPCYFGESGFKIIRLYNSENKLRLSLLNFLTSARFLELSFHCSQRKMDNFLYETISRNLEMFSGSHISSTT